MAQATAESKTAPQPPPPQPPLGSGRDPKTDHNFHRGKQPVAVSGEAARVVEQKAANQYKQYQRNWKLRASGNMDGCLSFQDWLAYEEKRITTGGNKGDIENEQFGNPLIPPKNPLNRWVWLKSLDPSLWESELIIYLYRSMPITDRKATEKENCVYITKFSEAIEQQQVMELYGSGHYKCMLNQSIQSKNGGKPTMRPIYVWDFRILNENYPPEIPYGEWMEDPKNKDWQWAKQAMLLKRAKSDQEFKREMNQQQPQQQTPSASNTLTDLANAVTMLSPKEDALNKHLVEELKSARDTSNPNAAIETIKQIALILKPAEGSGSNTMIEKMLDAQRDEMKLLREQNNNLLLRMIDNKPTTRSLKEELMELKELNEAFFGGKGKATETEDWVSVAMKGLDTLSQYAPMLIAAAANNGPVQPAQPPAVANGAARRTAAQQQPTATTAAPQTEEEKRQMMREQINAQFGPLLDRITPTLAVHFRDGNGNTFQDWFKDEYGKQTYGVLHQFAQQTILDVFKMRREEGNGAPPEVRALLAQLEPADKLEMFVTQFMDDTEPTDEEEPPPAAEPPPPAVQAAPATQEPAAEPTGKRGKKTAKAPDTF